MQAYRPQKSNLCIKFDVESELEVEQAQFLHVDPNNWENDPDVFGTSPFVGLFRMNPVEGFFWRAVDPAVGAILWTVKQIPPQGFCP